MPHYTSDLSFASAIEDIAQMKKNFVEERLIFVEGQRMVALLHGLGASWEDLENIKRVSNSLEGDPTLPFRRSKNGRFFLDFDKNQLRRLEFQEFILSAGEDFVRHDSNRTRIIEEITDDLQGNSALHALYLFKALMIRDVPTFHRPGLEYNNNSYVCTLFNLRTVTTPELVGEPALEGVHSDGVDFTMTTFLGAENMTADSVVTFVHDNSETTAGRWHETNPKLLRSSSQHKHFLDTLLFADAERKHSLSAVSAQDPSKMSTRDMLIFFTRKPVVEGHVSYDYDSLIDHKELPLVVDWPVFRTSPVSKS